MTKEELIQSISEAIPEGSELQEAFILTDQKHPEESESRHSMIFHMSPYTFGKILAQVIGRHPQLIPVILAALEAAADGQDESEESKDSELSTAELFSQKLQ